MDQAAPPIPAGYWSDARGRLTPITKVKPIDKARNKVVTELCEAAQRQSAALFAFKAESMHQVTAFVAQSLAEYGVAHGGQKGNITLVSYDGKVKIVRQMAENISFDERLQAAKVLIDECIQGWSKGSNDEIKALINNAFQVDTEGKISKSRVLGLRSIDIKDPTWLRAMAAIVDSMRVDSTKPYIRFYLRDDASGEYQPIVLDLAAV